jgi:molybdenum cofactor biosynthesis enzyme MoaA
VRSQRVAVTRLCNQNCAFCTERAPVDEAFAVRAALENSGAEEILITGGEPTLRSDLPGIVAYAKRGGKRVILETNGALLDEKRVALLRKSGLDGARLHVPAWGDACDEITRDPGGFARTRAAMDLIAAAGIALELAAPIVRDNRDRVVHLPAHIAQSGLPVKTLFLGVPVRAPDVATLLSLEDAARVIAEVGAAARSQGVTVRVDPAAPVPPCLLPEPARLAHLFSLTRGGVLRGDQVKECEGCAVADRCPGLPRGATAKVRPIADDRTRRRLSLISTVEEQVAREIFQSEPHRCPDGTTLPGGIVRVNFHCNQSCRFCFVSTHLPPPEERAVEEAIARVARDQGRLTISGGEPTLNARLVEWVRLGRRLGVREIELQTNAVRIDDTLARSLDEAGVSVALVSLHACDAETSDAITEAPGTFEKTVRGIDELCKTNIEVWLNFVICERNWRQFAEYVEFVAQRWPKAAIVVSFVGPSTEMVPRERSLIPRYRDVLPVLAAATRRAHELGVALHGFESMCGVPLCLVPDDLSQYFKLAEVNGNPGEFLKTETCAACKLDSRCWGLRRGYAELYGSDELRAV